MSTLTLCCFVDAPATLLDLLTAEFSDCRVRLATTAPTVSACLEQLVANGDQVALAIVAEGWLTMPELQAFYDQFPQALTVVLAAPEAIGRGSVGPRPIYRCLAYPGPEAELVFTVSAALAYYRQGQQLALAQTALTETHRQLDTVQVQLAALALQLDWGVSIVGDRVETEQALRQSQSSLAEAQRIAQMGSWEFDLASQTITWSAEVFRLYGLDPAQPAPSYEQWQQTIPAADWPTLQAAIERVIATGTAYEVEHRIVRLDGTVRYMLTRGEAVYNHQGQVVQLRGMSQDRTDARLAEIALEQSEARNQAILSAVPDLMIVLSAEGQCLDFSANGFTGELVPMVAQGSVGHHIADALPAEVACQWVEAIARTLTTHTTQFFEQQLSFGDRTQYEVVRMVPYQADQVLVLVRDISDRQLAEQAQQESDTRFRQLAETVREGFFIFDAVAMRYEYLNPAYAAILGVDLAAVNDLDHWLNGVHPEDRDRIAAAAAQEMQGTSTDCEYRFLHPDGEVRWLHCQAFPIADAAGTVLRVVGTVKDITDRKQAELALEQTKERYRRATQAARTGVWELDLKTQRGYLDPTIAALAGYDSSQVGDSLADWLEFVHPEDQGPLRAAMQRYYSGESAKFFFEYRLQHCDGSTIWVLSRGELHRDAEGEPETFLGTTTDITPLKQAELALKQLNEELEQRVQERTQTLQTLAAVVENSTDLIGTASLSGATLYLNQAGRRLVGLEDEPLAGRPISTLHTAETRLRLEQEVLPTVIAEGVWRGEVDFCHGRTGEAIAVEQVAFLVKDPDTQVPLCLATVCRDIRDRKRSEIERQQAELALQESEARFRQIAETIQEVFWMATADSSQILYVSPAFEQVFGIPCETLYRSPQAWLDSVHPDDRVAASMIPRPITTTTYDNTYRICRADGEQRWVHVRSFPLCNEAGEVDRVVGVSTDITERRQAELSLQENEKLFRGIFEQSAMGIIEADLDEQIVRVNQIFCDLVGYSEADLLTMTYTHLTHPDDIELDQTHVERLLRGDLPSFVIEKRYLHSDGSAVWVALAVSLVRDGQGQPQYMLGVVNDISDRKQAELALQESRNMLKLVLDTIPQRVFWKDRQSRFLGCNPAFASDYGLTPDGVIGKTEDELPWASYASKYQADDAQVMATRQPKLGYEERASTVGNQDLWTLTSKVPLTNADDVVIGVLGCYEDITARKQVEASLLQLNQELEQRVQERTWALEQAVEISEAANQAKSAFLANMSHELRTPLNAILGFTQLMARDTTLSEEHSQSLSIINRSGEHLLMLINDILEMAKIESGQMTLNPACFDLNALLSILGDMFYLRAQHKGLALVIDRHPALPTHFKLDLAKLRQVLINLLGNAIKFTQQGQVTLRVTPADVVTRAFSPDAMAVTFTVSDTGVGLATGDRDRLFEPFVQANQDSGGGTGLGLSISRQFVQMLGGELTVESQPGQGATFAFTLPMPVVEAVDRGAAVPATQVVGLAAGQPSYRLLVVDDDDNHRYLLNLLLQSVGFEVREAANGQEAIDLWQRWRPQLIWLDMRMPVVSGYEAAQAIRTLEEGSAQAPTKIVALTANAFEDDRARALSSGCDDFLRKPFHIDLLLAKLTDHLGVQYIYGPPTAPPSPPPPLNTAEAIALLRALPRPQLQQMQQATLQLDSDQLLRIMAQLIPVQAPLTGWLTQQINDFAFDTIYTLLQNALDEP